MPKPPSSPAAVRVLDWGRTRYRDALARQQDLVVRRLAGEIGDTLAFTEHEPVFTLGLRAGSEAHLLWDASRRALEGVEVVQTNRGGDITYHGPGQIVGYPIVSLVPHPDLHDYLRLLEQVLIDAVAGFGVLATRREGLTGIWCGRRKLAAIGVSVRRWVTHHGFALNVTDNLAPFAGIVPCGIGAAEGTVTSLQAELGREVDPATVRLELATVFDRQWTAFLKPPTPEAYPAARGELA